MTDLPPGWTGTNLGTIGEYLNGRGFKKSEWREAGRPIIRIQNLTGRSREFNYFDNKPEERYTARRGDILVSWAATLGVFVWNGPEAVVNQHIFKVRSHIDHHFHRYLLLSVLNDLQRQTHGSGMVHITKNRFENTPIRLPPLAEQSRIVAAIEEQFSRLAAGTAALEMVRENIKRMRAAVVEAAVAGRLVAQVKDATASTSLVEQLRIEATEAGGRKNKSVAGVQTMSFPKAWQLVSLGELAESITYGTSEKATEGVHGVPVLRMGNLGWGTISYKSLKYLPSDELDARLVLEPGDLLFNRTNSAELVGKTAVFQGYSEPIAFASYLIRVRPLPSANLEWAALVINSSIGRRYVASVRNQQVGQANVNGTKLAAAPIPLPGEVEQKHILRECERLFSLINDLEKVLHIAIAHSVRLRSSVLIRAFSGRLASQDAKDEPASVLLARIAAERASSNGHKSVRPMASTPGSGDAGLRQLRMGIQLMWEDCYSKAEIAETMEISPIQLTSEITRMRRQGWDLPKRRRKATA